MEKPAFDHLFPQEKRVESHRIDFPQAVEVFIGSGQVFDAFGLT